MQRTYQIAFFGVLLATALPTIVSGFRQKFASNLNGASDAVQLDKIMLNLEKKQMLEKQRVQSEEGAIADNATEARGCEVPRNLHSRFKDIKKAGEGANGCAFFATDSHNGNANVVIKTAKQLGRLHKWKEECKDMQDLRRLSCAAGQASLDLAEQYMPVCLEVGGSNDEPYMVMHDAGAIPIRDFRKIHTSKEDRKSFFAQLVGAIFAMHSIGKSHNDLHVTNIMFDADTKSLALIDFGDVRPLSDTPHMHGYKRDGNAITTYGPQFADCGGDFRSCLKSNWGVDDKTLHEVGVLADHNNRGDRDQHIAQLFETPFVQQHLPPPSRRFQWDGCKAKELSPQCRMEKSERVNCHITTVDEEHCEAKGCCWAPDYKKGVPWCFNALEPEPFESWIPWQIKGSMAFMPRVTFDPSDIATMKNNELRKLARDSGATDEDFAESDEAENRVELRELLLKLLYDLTQPSTTTTTTTTLPEPQYIGCYELDSSEQSDYDRMSSPERCSSLSECHCAADYPYIGFTNGNGKDPSAEWICFRALPSETSKRCKSVGDWHTGYKKGKVSIYTNVQA